MATSKKATIEVAGREVGVSNPGKVFFPRTGHTKMDLIRYYLAVAGSAGHGGALGGGAGRPLAPQRCANRAAEGPCLPKRAPGRPPGWGGTDGRRGPSA